MDDNELLIKVDTKVTQLCDTMQRYEKNNREDHQVMIDTLNRNIERLDTRLLHKDDNCDDCKGDLHKKIDAKVGWTQFKWIIGGMATCMMGLLLTIGTTTLKIEDKMDKHLIESKQVMNEPQVLDK